MSPFRRLVLTAALSAGMSLPAFAVTFEQAIAIYQNNEFEQAQRAFKELAQLGNTKAQLNIAVMYVRGEYFEKDLTHAYAWAALAHEGGEGAAKDALSAISGVLDPVDIGEAEQRLEQLKKQYGETIIAERLKPTFTDSGGTIKPARPLASKRPRYPAALGRFGRSGWVDVELAVGKDGSTRYFKVLSSPNDRFSEAALESLRATRYEPAELDGKAIMTMSRSYRYVFTMEGASVKHKELAAFMAEKKEQAIHGGSDEKVAYAYQLEGLQSGVSVLEDSADITWDNPSEWYFEAAQEGSPLAKYKLGTRMLSGQQCDVSEDKGLFWLEQAAKDNVLDAKLALGYEYLVGVRYGADVEKGFALLNAAADGSLDHAKVFTAWILSTYPEQKYRDYARAADLLKQVDHKSYADSRSFWEASIATALGQEDWRSAKKLTKKVIKYNKKYEQPPNRGLALQQALAEKRAYVEQL